MHESATVKLGMRIFAWGLIILVVSILALTFRSLKPLELRYAELLPQHLSFAESSVSIFPLVSTDDSPTAYFRYVLQIVRNLKKAGARSVVVPIPPSTQYVPEVQELVRKIAAFDNVVFGDQLKVETPYQDINAIQLDDQSSWWAPHPMGHLVNMVWGISTVRGSPSTAILRIVPYQYRESTKGYTVPDVALQALKKFERYPDSIAIIRHANSVTVGTFAIPVWEDGFAYVRTRAFPAYNRFYAYVGPANDSLHYGTRSLWGGETAVSDSAWKALADKIVIITWPHLSTRLTWRIIGYAGAYQQVIDAVLTKTFMHRFDQWNLAVIFLAIVLAGALVFSLRTWLAVVILLCSEAGVLIGSLWLFGSQNAIFDPVYLLFTLTLCVTILPVAKVSYEKEYYRKKLDASDEAVAALEAQLGMAGGAWRQELPGNPTLPSTGRGGE